MRFSLILVLLAVGLVLPVSQAAQPKETRSRPAEVRHVADKAAVAVLELQWFDAQRGRKVPATVYYPTADGPFPVILFSHGLGRSRESYAYLGQDWAARGYVAVFLEHLGSDDEVWKGKLRPKKALKEALDDPINSINRPLDLSFAIDQLESLNHRGTKLGQRLDMDRIGAAGNDFGAQTVLALAGQTLPGGRTAIDPRVKAVVAMSPPVPMGQGTPPSTYGRIHIPCLHLTGSADDGRVGTTKAEDRRIPFELIRGADQYLVTFSGGDHMIYSGHQFPRTNDAKYQRLIALTSGVFWDAYLKDADKAKTWLASDGARNALGELGVIEKKLPRARTARSGYNHF